MSRRKRGAKRIASVVMAGFMTISMMPQMAYATPLSDKVDLTGTLPTLEEACEKIGMNSQSTGTAQKSISPEEEVTVVVSVDVKGVLDSYIDSNSQKEITDYLLQHTQLAATTEEKVKKVAEAATAVMEKDQVESQILYHYSTVFTGFSMTLPYKEISKVKAIAGVSSVKIANEYQVPETQEVNSDDLNMVTSRLMIGADKVQGKENLNYTGQGMVVAILDTGIDYTHEAFQTSLTTTEEETLQRKDITTMLDTLNLDAEEDFAANHTTGSTTLMADGDNGNGLNIYHSAKVPYGYDYTDHDVDCIPTTEQNHGTHVAGTVAGNCAQFQGVAPDAQIMSMKVFNDKGSTSDAVLLAALDDAVMLGADVINMSLGSAAGSTYEENEYLQDAYDTIEKAGVNLDCSAGNNATGSSENNYGDLQSTLNPDNGVVGSPSTLEAPMSVASVENTYLNYCNYITNSTGINMSYLDNGPDNMKLSILTAGTYPIVNCGLGTPEEVTAANTKDKVALIKRGGITFTEKVVNAVSSGAIAVVIYNNQPGTISMAVTDYQAPAVSITRADGELILNSMDKETGTGIITLNGSNTIAFENPEAMQMSSFSSWGPTPELIMKPEITTPGGNIYSSYYTDSNGKSISGLMSGTSMAAPHMSGATALVKEYVKETFSQLSPRATENLVNDLLMSTADPIVQPMQISDEEGTTQEPAYYSVRQQGAGLVDLKEAITSPAYLTVTGCERPKVELGYDTTGVFTFSFTVHNVSEQEVVYPLAINVETEDYVAYGESSYMSQREVDITDACTITYGGDRVLDNQVTVPANSSTQITAIITLNQESMQIQELNSVYTNGFYVEGFVQLGKGEENDLCLPFLGFYGDWGAAPVFDASFYNEEGIIPEYGNGNVLCSYVELGGNSYNFNLGGNLLSVLNTGKGGTYKADWTAVSTNSIIGLTGILTSKTYALRGCQNFFYQITDDQGNILDEETINYMPKSYYYTNGSTQTCCEDFYDLPIFNGYDGKGQPLAEGKYHIKISAEPMGVTAPIKNEISYSFLLDNTAPTVEKEGTRFYLDSEGNYSLQLTLSDNDYLSGTEVMAYSTQKKDWVNIGVEYWNHLDSEKVGNNWVLNYTLGKKEDFEKAGLLTDKLVVDVYDYAMNATEKEISFSTQSTDSTISTPTVIIGSGSTGVILPEDVTQLNGQNTTFGVISITWAKAKNAEGYDIFRMNSKGEYEKIGEVGADVTSFLDTNVVTGELYQYQIKPYTISNGEKIYGNAATLSNIGSFIPGRTTISSLRNRVRDHKNLITIKMKKVAGATGYRIYRCNKKNGTYVRIATVGKNKLTYQDTIKLNQNSCYYYKIQAIVKQDGKLYQGQMSIIKKINVKTR